MTKRQLFSQSTAASRRRTGFTLLEIMTSVTLALMLMYAVARIFSNVGGEMNEMMSTMEAANGLRNAKNRLTQDLECLSVAPAPPRNSRQSEGYFCCVEGMGGPFERVASVNAGRPFATGDVALDRERFESNPADGYSDNTVGDLDDILSFTAKAPVGQHFRGRFIEPIYADQENEYGQVIGKKIIDARETTIESEYAEIVWFVRGTTLYRRVLPIVSDYRLQESFKALDSAADIGGSIYAGINVGNIRQGFGFYRFYDVSVHLGANGNLVANNLSDLSNRENRYFYWNSCGKRLHPDSTAAILLPYSPHGANGAWYWLKMATLQESAAPNFRAGAPFGQDSLARDSWLKIFLNNPTNPYYSAARSILGGSTGLIADYWGGFNQQLTLTVDAGETGLAGGNYSAANLPDANMPFIDFWNAPNVWNETNYETGDLLATQSDFTANANGAVDLTFNQDVVLTNVLSFNVRVWDPKTNAYVDLGSGVASGDSVSSDAADLRSFGRYADASKTLFLPCVYDTWTEQYQRDFCVYDDYMNALDSNHVAESTGMLTQIPLDGTVSSANLPDFAPPYDVRLQSVQIEIRVFDPRSKRLRNATFNVDLSKL